MNILNKTGPRKVPCNTPDIKQNGEKVFLIYDRMNICLTSRFRAT